MMRAAVGAVAFVVVLAVSDARAEWATMAPMPGGARWAHAAAEAGGKMYVMGGKDDDYTITEEYDPGSNGWQSKDDVPFSCCDARAVGSGGLVYLTGGRDYVAGTSTASLYVLDPGAAAGSQWTALAPMNQAREMHAAAVLGGKIYVFGGGYDDGATGTALSSVEAYDIAAGTWDASVADLPQTFAGHTATTVGAKIYLVGGVIAFPAGPILDTVYEFDPAGGGTYTPKVSMPTATCFHAAAGAGGLIYVTGGVTIVTPAPDAVTVCEVYDTAVDTWFTATALPRELRLHGSCSIGTTVYVVGGEGPVSGASDANYAWTTPWVVSVLRADVSPTNASAVDFTVTFNEDVTGVDAADFVVTGSGVTGDVTAVTPLSASVYTVTVGNITGEGDLGLNVVDNETIEDTDAGPLGGPGPSNGDHTCDETYTIDTTAPDAPVVIGATPTTDATPTWIWTSGASAGDGTFRCQVDGEDPGSWTQTTALDYTPSTALPVGPHTLYVQESDDAGNWSASGSFEITIDAPPPPSDDSGCLPGSGAPGGLAVTILALAAALWARRAGAGPG